MPNFNKILLKLEEFYYATPLGLNIEYYLIRLTEDASYLCNIIIP